MKNFKKGEIELLKAILSIPLVEDDENPHIDIDIIDWELSKDFFDIPEDFFDIPKDFDFFTEKGLPHSKTCHDDKTYRAGQHD